MSSTDAALSESLSSIQINDDQLTAAPQAPISSKPSKVTTTSSAREWTEDMQHDYERILSVGEECISAAELKGLILAKGRGSGHELGFNLYDGFEPSGRMHIAQGVFKAMNVNKCTLEGTNSTFVFWVADWFALMNDKMGGDLDRIRTVGEYLIEVWKAAGMNLNHVVFKWASDEITRNANQYWPIMLDVARSFNITRIKKCCQIMGRLEGSLTSAQVLYPLMQCTDVFFLKADICQLGVDQRKVNMLAREYCDAAGIKRKPVILSHHMLYGLKAGQEKMSKSDPDSAIFMEDTEADVERKIMAAYCPIQEQCIATNTLSSSLSTSDDAGKESMHLKVDALKNPCLDYIEHIIFSPPGATFNVGSEIFSNFESVKKSYLSGTISEYQLKTDLIRALNELLEPVRYHFTNDNRAKDLLEKVQKFKKDANVLVAGEKGNIRRLDLKSTGTIDEENHVVFAPFPCATPTLQEAYNTLKLLKMGLSNKESSGIVLYLPDWTARVCNYCDGDEKIISAYYSVFVTSIRSLDSDLMKNVTVLKQSHAILVDPSNYWVSVINAGRFFMLDDVMGENLVDSDCVGRVIGRLMKIADIMALNTATIGFLNGPDGRSEMNLINRYFEHKIPMLLAPKVSLIEETSLQLQERTLDVHKTDNDEYFLLDDAKVHGKSKMKKAFCEPGNTSFCPPLVFLTAFGPSEVSIERSTENGGNVTYHSHTQMEEDFQNGHLHPGDLKTVASSIMFSTLESLTKALKDDTEVMQALKALKAYAKKKSK